jgi:NADPH:quinone reductase-like Zn-dependent oxidoreductase
VLQRLGRYPPPPGASDIPGLEIAGTVVAVGEGATALLGRAVCALVTAAAMPNTASRRPPLPAGARRLPLAEAAALPETLFTVWHNVFERGWAREGETCWSTAAPAASARWRSSSPRRSG